VPPLTVAPSPPVVTPDTGAPRPSAQPPAGPASFDKHLHDATQANPGAPGDPAPANSQQTDSSASQATNAGGAAKGKATDSNSTTNQAAGNSQPSAPNAKTSDAKSSDAKTSDANASAATTQAGAAIADLSPRSPSPGDPKPVFDPAANSTPVPPAVTIVDLAAKPSDAKSKPTAAVAGQASASAATNGGAAKPAATPPAPPAGQLPVEAAAAAAPAKDLQPVAQAVTTTAVTAAVTPSPPKAGVAKSTSPIKSAGGATSQVSVGDPSDLAPAPGQTRQTYVQRATGEANPASAPAGASAVPTTAEQIASQADNPSQPQLSAALTAQVAASANTAATTTSVKEDVKRAAENTALAAVADASSAPAPTPAAASPAAASSLVAPPATGALQQNTSGSQTAVQTGSAPSGVTEVDRTRFVQRVARAFQTVGDQGGSLRLRLSPPELGSVKLDVSIQDGVLKAHMQAETPAARELLLGNLPELRERLAEHNIKVAQFEVDLFDPSTGGSSDQPRGNSDPEQAYVAAVPRGAGGQGGTTGSSPAEPAAAPSSRISSIDGSLNVVV